MRRPTPSPLVILLILSSMGTTSQVSASASTATATATAIDQASSPSIPMNDMKRLASLDHVSMTKEAANLRSKHLQRKKPILQKSVSITSLLFPGTEPIEYTVAGMSSSSSSSSSSSANMGTTGTKDDSSMEMVPMFVEYVESRKTPIGVDYYELPVCPQPSIDSTTSSSNTLSSLSSTDPINKPKNLGQRLMGHSTQPLGYEIPTKVDKSCTILCHKTLKAKQIRLLQKLIHKQYRVHFTLDSLPILVRSQDLNHAIRGYPLGFVITDGVNIMTGKKDHTNDVYYLNNHLRFTIYYNDNTSIPLKKIHITGFDVKPVSIRHNLPETGWDDRMQGLSTCNADTKDIPGNIKETFLPVRTGPAGEDMEVVYSYEVIWKHSEIEVCWFFDSFFFFLNSRAESETFKYTYLQKLFYCD